jgi:hypothetical protein
MEGHMTEPTCPNCRTRFNHGDFASMLRSIPETDRERLLRDASVRRAGPLPSPGEFTEGPEGELVFVPASLAQRMRTS